MLSPNGHDDVLQSLAGEEEAETSYARPLPDSKQHSTETMQGGKSNQAQPRQSKMPTFNYGWNS